MRHLLAIVAASAFAVTPAFAVSPPKPTKSDYLVTTGAGFVMKRGEGLQYGMNYELRKTLTEPLYIVATFENPEDADTPLRLELIVEAGAKEFMVQSPLIKVITHDTKYEVLLELYGDPNHSQLFGTHKQAVLFSVPPAYEATVEKQMGIEIH